MECNKQYGGIDYFKIVSALLVIAIHTSPLSSFNSNADFVFTRIIARMAVPFFLMTTGYFLLPQYLFGKSKDRKPLYCFLKKTLFLYMIVIVIYIPVNIYAGQFNGVNLLDIFRMLIFDGTIYHLWYLPASILGVLLLYFLGSKLPFKLIVSITIVLYGFGLLGDSYFGVTSNCLFLKTIYNIMFSVFSYTRNGIFYAPVFLAFGAGIRQIQQRKNNTGITIAFAFSVALLIAEGLTLHGLNIQRHDSMYIALLPCMFFLFQIILSMNIRPVKAFRSISSWIYIIHPLFIILVRGIAKLTHTESILINNSFVHYITVCFLSCVFGITLEKILNWKRKQPFCIGRAWIELDKNNLCQNIIALRSLLPQDSQLMPAVKANAYGHGAVLLSKELNRLGIKSFCVATVTEGIELRRNGIKGDILILGYTNPEQFPMLRKYHLTQTVIDFSYAQCLNTYGKKIKVHLKIDTGMHRLGERFERIDNIYDIFHCKNLIVTGAYTHLCADETTSERDRKFTSEQGAAFYRVVSDLEKHGYSCGKLHILASYGLINYSEFAGDYVRIGIALYGVLSNRSDLDNCPIKLHPVLSVKARVALTKDLYAGESAGYGLQYIAERNTKIAVLTIGYADGLPRSLSCGIGKVLVNNNEAPIIGRICMDQTLVDITDIPYVQQGDIAIIIGKSGEHEITAYDIAEQSSTITNEVLSRLGNRLDRVII